MLRKSTKANALKDTFVPGNILVLVISFSTSLFACTFTKKMDNRSIDNFFIKLSIFMCAVKELEKSKNLKYKYLGINNMAYISTQYVSERSNHFALGWLSFRFVITWYSVCRHACASSRTRRSSRQSSTESVGNPKKRVFFL